MSRQFTREFYLEVARGNIAGHSLVHKYGRNNELSNGTEASVDFEILLVDN